MDINKFCPTGAISKKHLVSLANYTESEIYEILVLARDIATRLSAGEKLTFLKNKFISLITKRSFARSRIAFETAVTKLGGTPIVSTMHGSELENAITDKFTIEAIAGYGVNAIVVQTAEATDAEQVEKAVNIPIINANSKTKDLSSLVKIADIVISCVGRQNLINAQDIKEDAIVIGVGFTYINGKQILDFDVEEIVALGNAKFVSNRINCTGKATINSLIDNVVELYKMNFNIK